MTATARSRRTTHAHLRTAEQVCAAVAFLGAVAVLSLPALLPGWAGVWLLLWPLAGLAAARALAWSRRTAASARTPGMVRRRRPAVAMARRRPATGRTGGRALAAIVLR